MAVLHQFLHRVRAFFRRKKLDRDMAEEMQFHLRQSAAENIAAGMPHDEAQQAALKKFGGVEQLKERAREERGFLWLEHTLRDVRFAARMLWKSPGFAVVTIAVLALGIGANATLFSIVNAVLLRPLPYPASDRLVWVGETRADLAFSRATPGLASYPNFEDWRTQQTVFEAIGAYQPIGGSPGAFLINDEPVRLEIQRMSADAFVALRTPPLLGRVFNNEEDKRGGVPSVVLSYRTWRQHFGGSPSVIGQPVTMNGVVHIILGVMPPGFSFPYERVEAWLPLGAIPLPQRIDHSFACVARLKPGVTLDQARAGMATIGARLETAYPDANRGWKSRVEPLAAVVVGDAGRPLWILFGAVGLVLLIACANVANLLIARGSVRQQEMAVRVALGASRGRIVRQLLAESLLLAFTGAGLGLLLAQGGLAGFVALAGNAIPRASEIRLDGGVLAFAVAIAAVTGIVFGLAPAWKGGNAAVHDTLKLAGGRGDTGDRARLRQGLIVAEVALTLLLLTGAGLLFRSFERLQSVAQGFSSERVVSFDLGLPGVKYNTAPMRAQFFDALVQKLRTIPGIEDVGLTTRVPLKQKSGEVVSYAVVGREKPPGATLDSTGRIVVSPGYFGVMGIPLLRGRLFTELDGPDGEKVAIVDDEFVRRHWPSGDPIGQHIRIGTGTGQELTVVGVVAPVKLGSLSEQGGFVQTYMPLRQRPGIFVSVVLKTRLAPATLAMTLRDVVRGIDPAQPIHNLGTIEEIRDSSLAPERLNLSVLGLFALVALSLSVVGLYGVLAYSVARRRREIGVRMALGAQPADVLRLVIGEGLRLTGLGIFLGLVAALWLTQWLASLLFEVTPLDPLTFATVSLLLLAVAFVACWLPARRAAKVNPLVALHCE